ncbi:MAG: DNA/RNA nuclease SfsA [Oscillospiraceae bacterium]
MRYDSVAPGRFLARPNRFIARVELDGAPATVHVKNTGRCRELLVPGCRVYCAHEPSPRRKTAYDLIAAEKGGRLINLDSQAPNRLFAEWAAAGGYAGEPLSLRPEYTYGDSRFDFRLDLPGRTRLVEVKGVTLERSGHASFPDAPTERGLKHLRGLMRAVGDGLEAAVVFVIQMEDVLDFSPADDIHPAFGAALRQAAAAGVRVEAYDCAVRPEELFIRRAVPVRL